jgi:hypothetical protein
MRLACFTNLQCLLFDPGKAVAENFNGTFQVARVVCIKNIIKFLKLIILILHKTVVCYFRLLDTLSGVFFSFSPEFPRLARPFPLS